MCVVFVVCVMCGVWRVVRLTKGRTELIRANNPYKYHPYRCHDCNASQIEGILYSSIPHTPTPNPVDEVVHLCAPCWKTRYAFSAFLSARAHKAWADAFARGTHSDTTTTRAIRSA